MNTTILEGLISRALSTIDEHESAANRDLFFSIMVQLAEDGDNYIDDAEDYAEPGYDLDNPEMPILFANWNSETRWNKETNKSETISNLMPLLGQFAEAIGCSIEWSDEWSICECRKAFRTSGDSYSWTMYGAMLDGLYMCGDCIKEDPDAYFEEISGDPRMAITIDGVNPEDHGFTPINNEPFEYGMYGGQAASADAIARTLRSAEITDFLFSVDSVGQFDMKFSVYVREDDLDRAVAALESGETACAVDPAVALERGLKAATAAMSQLKDEDGVKYATVHPDGTASARTVSPQEFVEGVKS